MCGISVVVEHAPGTQPVKALQRMHELLRHRGPDGEGHLWVDANGRAQSVHGAKQPFPPAWEGTGFAASFRWLQVQDREPSANQPMASRDGRAWMLFNGEIYNYREMRSELSALGTEFRTQSDTEVLLAAYRQWGADCLSRLRGMWAFVCVDLDRRSVMVARDRLGIKPLYYALDGRRLLIASEAKAVALAHREGVQAEPFRVHEYLRGLPPQSAELSFFRGVLPVPAGSWAELPLDREPPPTLMFRSYWSLADQRQHDLPESKFESCREEFEALLRSSADEHAHADVDVGTLLSGGLDTSTLARLLADRATRDGHAPPNAYSIIYEDPEMSEWPYMQFVIGQGGLRGVKHVLTPGQAWEASEAVVTAQGQPLLGQDIIAMYHAYRLARENGSVVVWDGQGPDDMMAGLPLYEGQWLLDLLRSGRWLTLASELRLRMRRYGHGLRQTTASYVVTPLWRRWMERRGLPHFPWLRRDLVDSSAHGPGRTGDWGPEESLLAQFLFRHVRHTNLPQILVLQDHCSMAHGIESRVPFLDHRLVEFVFGLPDRFKLHNGTRKRILLETARRWVPAQVANRRDKRVFVSKITWMKLREKRAQALREAAASRELREFALIEPRAMQRFVDDFLAGRHDNEQAVWRLHSLWQWLRTFRAQL